MKKSWLPACCALLLLAGTARALEPTPPQPKGPFYPLRIPAGAGTDLTQEAGRQARGEPLVVAGRVLGRDGAPVADALVEIWQTNAYGRYHHPHDDSAAPLDEGFGGYGRTRSGADGGYRFRTVRPAAYGGRAPHIHVAVTAPGARTFYTQMYFAGDPANERDGIWRALDPGQRQLLTVAPAPPGPGAQPQARFDIVLP